MWVTVDTTTKIVTLNPTQNEIGLIYKLEAVFEPVSGSLEPFIALKVTVTCEVTSWILTANDLSRITTVAAEPITIDVTSVY